MYKTEVTAVELEEFVPMNTSYQKDAIHRAVESILDKITDKSKKKSIELIIKNDIRKVTGSRRWDVYSYEDHALVFNILRNGYHFYVKFGSSSPTDTVSDVIQNEYTDEVSEELPSYQEVKLLHSDWMMPKQIAYSLGISVQRCSSKINKLNIKSNSKLVLPYFADLDVGRKLCWLYNPVVIKMMG